MSAFSKTSSLHRSAANRRRKENEEPMVTASVLIQDRRQDRADISDFRDWLAAKGRSGRTERTYLQSVESLSGFLESRGMHDDGTICLGRVRTLGPWPGTGRDYECSHECYQKCGCQGLHRLLLTF